MSKTRVLVVEDSEDFRYFVCWLLKQNGFDPVEAGDAERGFEMLKADPDIRLLISDIHLPHEDGLWLCREAKRLGRCMRIILMSGEIAANSSTLRRSGHDAFLRKPFDGSSLISAVIASP